jgi:hypothetical protein
MNSRYITDKEIKAQIEPASDQGQRGVAFRNFGIFTYDTGEQGIQFQDGVEWMVDTEEELIDLWSRMMRLAQEAAIEWDKPEKEEDK